MLLLLLSRGNELNPPPPTPTPLRKHTPKFKGNGDNQPDDENSGVFKRKGMHFIHLNARSLVPKISDLRLIAKEYKATVTAITETW